VGGRNKPTNRGVWEKRNVSSRLCWRELMPLRPQRADPIGKGVWGGKGGDSIDSRGGKRTTLNNLGGVCQNLMRHRASMGGNRGVP